MLTKQRVFGTAKDIIFAESNMFIKQSAFKSVFSMIMVIAVYGLLVMLLWNLLLTDLFKFPSVNFAQAIGLFLLARIMFDGGGGRMYAMMKMLRAHRNTLADKWNNISEEGKRAFLNAKLGEKEWPFSDPFEEKKEDTSGE